MIFQVRNLFQKYYLNILLNKESLFFFFYYDYYN